MISSEKKFLIDSTCVSPIPSNSAKLLRTLSILSFLNSCENSLTEIKKAAITFAFSWPICLIPIEKMGDASFQNKIEVSAEEMKAIAAQIAQAFDELV